MQSLFNPFVPLSLFHLYTLSTPCPNRAIRPDLLDASRDSQRCRRYLARRTAASSLARMATLVTAAPASAPVLTMTTPSSAHGFSIGEFQSLPIRSTTTLPWQESMDMLLGIWRRWRPPPLGAQPARSPATAHIHHVVVRVPYRQGRIAGTRRIGVLLNDFSLAAAVAGECGKTPASVVPK